MGHFFQQKTPPKKSVAIFPEQPVTSAVLEPEIAGCSYSCWAQFINQDLNTQNQGPSNLQLLMSVFQPGELNRYDENRKSRTLCRGSGLSLGRSCVPALEGRLTKAEQPLELGVAKALAVSWASLRLPGFMLCPCPMGRSRIPAISTAVPETWRKESCLPKTPRQHVCRLHFISLAARKSFVSSLS